MTISPKAFKRLEKKERLRKHLEAEGGTLIWINWNKRTVHYLNRNHQKVITSL